MKLLELLTESPNSQGAFKALIIMGPPGSGKSTLRSKFNLPAEIVVIDYDEYQKRAATQQGIEKIDVDTRKQLSKGVMKGVEDDFVEAVNNTLPLLIDTVGSSEHGLLKRIHSLQNVGYDVAIVAVDVDVNVSLNRIQQRAEQEKRDVDPHFTHDAHSGKPFVFAKAQDAVGEGNFIYLQNNSANNERNVEKSKVFVNKLFSSPIQNPKGVKLKQQMIQRNIDTISPDLIPTYEFMRFLAASIY
jgi:predicted ABC-type ATPase